MLTAAVYTVVDAFLRSPILKLLKDHDKPGTISQFEHLSLLWCSRSNVVGLRFSSFIDIRNCNVNPIKDGVLL